MSVFYPQGVVSLRLRFEDFGDKTNAVYKADYPITTFAKSLRVNINDYNKADTFDMQLDYKQFPFDPRLLRSVGVTIYIEDKKKLFQSGANQDDNPLNTIKPDPKNIVFVGFADKSKIELNDNDRTVHLEGRDFTALLIDLPYFGGPVNLTLPIDQAIRAILDANEATKNIAIEKRLDPGEVIPVLAALGTDLSQLGGSKNAQKDDSYWEIIQRIIGDAGLIAYIELDKLIITKPRNLYDRTKSKIFAYGRNVKMMEFDRKLGRQKGFNIRIVSVDLLKKSLIEAKIPEEAQESWAKALGIKREPVKIPKPIAFQLNASLPTTPGAPPATPQAQVNPGVNAATATPDEVAPYFTFKVTNIVDKDHLIQIGQKIYEELGRQQLEGTFESHEMLVADSLGEEFNVMQLRIGTPLEVIIDGSDLEGIKKIVRENKGNPTIDSTVVQRKVKQFLIAQGYHEGVSNLVEVMSTATAKIDTPFFTKEIEYQLEENSGFTLKVDFVNFIVVPQALLE
jgi:hypothetical protein